MAESLKSKTLHALSWSFVESIGLQGVRFVIGIILARLLFPEEFGLIGMLTIFIAVAQTFLDSGFGAALIQKKNVTITDTCSIFYFNIAVGIITAGSLCLAAPWIGAFYNQPILTPITRALSLIIVINSFGLIQDVILRKEIDFKTQTKASLIANVLSGAIGVTLAARGFGVWSLVVQQVLGSLLRTACLWIFNPWRPFWVFSYKSLRKMFPFGSRLLASGLLDQIFNNIYLVAIGRLFSAGELGLYTRAKNLEEVPSQTLAGMIGRVTFPVFSTIQDDRARLKRGLRKALKFLVLINFPMMIGLAVAARPLVLVLLTEKWAESIPYLQLLCFLGLLYPLHLINLNVLQAMGRSDYFLKLEIIKKALVVINIVITWRWGISAMIYGMIVTSMISYYLNSYYIGILIGYDIWEQLGDLFPYLLLAGFMGGVVFGAGLFPYSHYIMQLGSQIGTGIVVYFCSCRIFRLEAFGELWEMGWDKLILLKSGIAK